MKRESLKNILVSFISLILSVFVSFVAFSCIFRHRGGPTERCYTNLDWEHKDVSDIPCPRKSNIVHKVPGSGKTYEVKINSQGFRDNEYSIVKPPDGLRIAVVGDSVTFGAGVDIENTFVKQVELLLRSRCKKNIEVMNFGASGASTINELELIERKVVLYKPDVILLEIDPNDGEILKQIKEVDPFLDSFIIRLKGSRLELSRWLKCKMEFYKYRRYRKTLTENEEYNNMVVPFREIEAVCKREGISLAVVSYDPPYRGGFYDRVLAYIIRQGVPLLDISKTRFHVLDPQEKYVNAAVDNNGFPIDCHPSEYGSKVIAEEIAEFLTRLYPFACPGESVDAPSAQNPVRPMIRLKPI